MKYVNRTKLWFQRHFNSLYTKLWFKRHFNSLYIKFMNIWFFIKEKLIVAPLSTVNKNKYSTYIWVLIKSMVSGSLTWFFIYLGCATTAVGIKTMSYISSLISIHIVTWGKKVGSEVKCTGNSPPFSYIPKNTSYFTEGESSLFNSERALLNREYELEVRKSRLYKDSIRIAATHDSLSLQINNGSLPPIEMDKAKQELCQLNIQINIIKDKLNQNENLLNQNRKTLHMCSYHKGRMLVNRKVQG